MVLIIAEKQIVNSHNKAETIKTTIEETNGGIETIAWLMIGRIIGTMEVQTVTTTITIATITTTNQERRNNKLGTKDACSGQKKS